MDNENNKVLTNGRVYYVEPNDVYGDDFSVVPYEDLCIAFNLTAEVYDRQGNKISSDTWGIEYNGQEAAKHVNFLTGMGEHGYDSAIKGTTPATFLTTYYTDISGDDIANRQIVEGLGVESIQISYENYYAPRVQIKFIDVRGSALFGKEETIHNEAGEITGENVFGAFFTIPYPKFRLQVKGFYGDPVTFQLACESFKGNFNAQNGNFEANVTFIGYQYSLLTDLPMRYLIAAPLNEQYGKEYWEKNKTSANWALSDGQQPPTLFDIVGEVKRALMDEDERRGALASEQASQAQQLSDYKTEYSVLQQAYNSFVDILQNKNENGGSIMEMYTAISDGNEGEVEQILLMYNGGRPTSAPASSTPTPFKNDDSESSSTYQYQSDFNVSLTYNKAAAAAAAPTPTVNTSYGLPDTKEIKMTPTVSTLHNNLIHVLDEYNKGVSYGNAKSKIEYSKYPNGKHEEWADTHTFSAKRMLNKVLKDKKWEIKLCSGNVVENDRYLPLSDMKTRDIVINGITMNKRLKERLMAYLTNETDGEKIGEYWILFDLKTLASFINSNIRDCTSKVESIMNNPGEKDEININNVLSFEPNISNIFKIVMCHLETFCHILYSMANVVDDKHRTPESTGISLDKTDYWVKSPSTSKITYGPWPGVYNYGVESTDGGDTDTEIQRRAWIGDLPNNPFVEEEAIVKGFIRAVQRADEDMKKEPNVIMGGSPSMVSLPLLPCDILTAENDFPTMESNNSASYLSMLGGWLGYRTANIFGIFENRDKNGNLGERAKLYGKLDALNYYIALGSANKLNEDIIGNKSDLEGRLESIMTCKSAGQEYATRNVGAGSERRHEFETHRVKNSYCNGALRHPMYTESGDDYVYCHYYTEDGQGMIPSKLQANNAIYDNVFTMINNDDDSNVCYVPRLQNAGDYNDAQEYLYAGSDGPVMPTDKNSYIASAMFDVKYDNSDIDAIHTIKGLTDKTTFMAIDKEINIGDITPLFADMWKIDNTRFLEQLRSKGNAMYGPNINGKMVKGNVEKPSQFFNVESLLSNDNVFSDSSTIKDFITTDAAIHELNFGDESIFAHELYYMQNNAGNNKACRRNKLLLLLHTLKYERPDWSFLKKDKKNGGIENMPRGLALLFGGLLWRQSKGAETLITKGPDNEFEYKGIDINKTLFQRGSVEKKAVASKTKVPDYLPIKDFFGIDAKELDYRYANKFIMAFLDYADNKYDENYGILELKGKNGKLLDSKNFGAFKSNLLSIYDSNKGGFNVQSFGTFFKRLFKEGKVESNWEVLLNDYIRKETNIFQTGTSTIYKNVVKHYLGMIVKNGGIRLIINDDREITDIQNKIQELYAGEFMVFDMSGKFTKRDDESNREIKVGKNILKAYLKSFADTLSTINAMNGNAAPEVSETKEFALDEETWSREIAIDIYYYLKNIWDKWLLQHHKEDDTNKGQDYFNVEKFFKNNFLFLDKFYINIGALLPCNAKRVVEAISDIYSNRDASLYSFLSQICSDHNCLLFAMPDFINYGGDLKGGVNAVCNLFKAKPYEHIGKPREENMFVVMYADRPSDTATDKNGYSVDSFDIKLTGDPETDNLPAAFKSVPMVGGSTTGMHGYGVPAFGVSFGRQKQSIFKNISVNMNNPMTTSVSIQATTDIANMGKNTGRKVIFQGQDTFSIYNSYSYECEVEMMGNAQIMPMMYFQLLNVPMWRGAYMIMKVNHTITPGNMTTNFTGQKMSKISTPWCSKYALKAKDTASIDGSAGSQFTGGNTYYPNLNIDYSSNYPRLAYSEFDNIIDCNDLDTYRKNIYGHGLKFEMNGVRMRCELAKLHLAIRKEFEAATDNKYTIMNNSVVRDWGANGKSEHISGNAMDMNIALMEKPHVSAGKLYEQMFLLLDIIVTHHLNDVGQVILETKDVDGYRHTLVNAHSERYKNEKYGYKCLHMSCGNKTAASKFTGRQLYPNIWLSNHEDGVERFYSLSAARDCVPEFLSIAGRAYWRMGGDAVTFKHTFRNFDRLKKPVLDELFAPYKDFAYNTYTGSISSERPETYGVEDSNVFNVVQRYLGMPYAR